MQIKGNYSLLASFLIVFFVVSPLFIANLIITAYGQSQILPFDIGDIATQNNATSTDNLSNTTLDQSDEVNPCNMPPCPPGQACIQSCPQ
ncbi:MAG: hypothetical protein R2685_11530 [Candidatus Nitrosocosmicus sp.]|nr:hypothetical protein [Candidatus Nitrosocosmicus sp.]